MSNKVWIGTHGPYFGTVRSQGEASDDDDVVTVKDLASVLGNQTP